MQRSCSSRISAAWLPLFTEDENDYKWIADVFSRCFDGVDAKIALHFCYGNAWGNRLEGLFSHGYEAVLPHFYDLPIDQFVLDFANREMADINALKNLPEDKEVGIGAIDIRTSMIESPEMVAGRIRKILEHVPPERVYLTTDCGMKALPRIVARLKLKAMADGARDRSRRTDRLVGRARRGDRAAEHLHDASAPAGARLSRDAARGPRSDRARRPAWFRRGLRPASTSPISPRRSPRA